MRSEFEKWLDENNMFMEIERKFKQEHNTYEYCAIRWIWESWQHQQSKVDELQKRVDDLTELNRLKTIALQQSVNRTSPYVHEKIVA